MAPASNSIEPDEESKVLPTNQLYLAPFDLSGGETKSSKLELTGCNPTSSAPQKASSLMISKKLECNFPSSSSPGGTQSSSRFSSLAQPFPCPVCGKRFARINDMRRHQAVRHRRQCQILSQDDNIFSEFMAKREDQEDSLGYLHRVPSSKPGQSHATPEELDDRDSTQTLDTDESSSTTDTYVDNRKRQIIERIVFAVMQWFRSQLNVWRKNAGGNSNSASGISEALSGSHLRTESSNSIDRGNKKRKATERDDHETDNEDEGRNREYPRNNAKYKDWRTCPGPGWNDVHRVKEHLYRRHRQPPYRCARCWQPFTDEQGVMDHQRTDEPCPLQEMEYVEGFDAAQERSLKSRKRATQKLSETEKWRRVFNILFPHVLDDDIPSPFYDYTQVSQKEDACHPESGYLAQCEQYMLREVPQRLRQALGRELDRDMTIVEENLRRRAGDWVKTLLEEAFQELRQIRRLGSPAQQPEPSNHIPALAEGHQLPISGLPSVEVANLHFEGEGESWLDTFDFDSFDPSVILGELQSAFDNGGLIEGLLKSGEDGAGKATKQSDAGYVSNSPG
ncbi:Nicotinate-nucleotide diphosphorylase [Fusarium mundagurra]|uniref:Nicotinate-nucleotide diphosphorylase n=1 Tax=Fusarium mundagurra TaxID=1567541 RepID=A0A8H5Z417_9HYPO|nr:Nicotinate-nucleotide diphosphorylase [Fusarium mundagurra]